MYEIYFVACHFTILTVGGIRAMSIGKHIGALKVTVLCDNGQNLDN